MNTQDSIGQDSIGRDSIRIQSQKSPDQLEHEIDRQRDHIGEIIHALEGKLSPGQIFEQVLGYGTSGGREFASNLGETVKANPMPTLLTAAGLMWLYAGHNKRDGARYRSADTNGHGDGNYDGNDDKSALGERVGDMRDNVSDKMGSAKERVGESAHGAMDSARHQAHRANVGFHNMLDDNPMALGAIGIAVGALLGAMLPATRKEDELMGGASDRVTDKARHLARSGRDKATQAGHEITDPSSGNGDQQLSAQASPESRTTPGHGEAS